MTTIDNGEDLPNFLRLEPPQDRGIAELDRIGKWAQDPLKVVAENLRALTLEEATKMAEAMGDVPLRDRLNKWAVAYLDGGELPLKTERRL